MQFKHIWISSPDHLDKFEAIMNSSNIFQKIFGYLKIPDDFPQILKYDFGLPYFGPLRLYEIKNPVVFFGYADLSIDKSLIFSPAIIEPLKFASVSWNFKNIQPLSLIVNKSDIISVERFLSESYFLKKFGINWVRVKTKNNILNGDFLVCVGRDGFSQKTGNDETDKLYTEIMQQIK